MDINLNSTFQGFPQLNHSGARAEDAFTSAIAGAAQSLNKAASITFKQSGLEGECKGTFRECFQQELWNFVYHFTIKPIFTEFLANGFYNTSNRAVDLLGHGLMHYTVKPLVASADEKLKQAVALSCIKPELYATASSVYHSTGNLGQGVLNYTAKPLLAAADAALSKTAEFCYLPNPGLYRTASSLYHFVGNRIQGALDYLVKPPLAFADDKLKQAAASCCLPQPELYSAASQLYHTVGERLGRINDFATSWLIPEVKLPVDPEQAPFKASRLIAPAIVGIAATQYSWHYYAKALKEAYQLLPFGEANELNYYDMDLATFAYVKTTPPLKDRLVDIDTDTTMGSLLGLIAYCTNRGTVNALVEAGMTYENASRIVLGMNVAVVALPLIKRKISEWIKEPPELPSLIKAYLNKEPHAKNPPGTTYKVDVTWNEKKGDYIVRPQRSAGAEGSI